MILGEDPNYIGFKELGELFGRTLHQLHWLMKRGVFVAQETQNRVYCVHVDHLPEIADRIRRYERKLPYHPETSIPLETAASQLGITVAQVYMLRRTGKLDWATDELRHFISRESLEQLMWHRGLGRPRLVV